MKTLVLTQSMTHYEPYTSFHINIGVSSLIVRDSRPGLLTGTGLLLADAHDLVLDRLRLGLELFLDLIANAGNFGVCQRIAGHVWLDSRGIVLLRIYFFRLFSTSFTFHQVVHYVEYLPIDRTSLSCSTVPPQPLQDLLCEHRRLAMHLGVNVIRLTVLRICTAFSTSVACSSVSGVPKGISGNLAALSGQLSDHRL